MTQCLMYFVVDVSQSMSGPVEMNYNTSPLPAKSSESKYEIVRNFLLAYTTHRLLEGKKRFEMGVVACGSDTTNNRLNEDPTVGGYENIQTMLPLGTPSTDSLESLDQALCGVSTQAQCSITDGVIVGTDVVVKSHENLKWIRTIVIITDGESEFTPDDMDAWQDHILPSMNTGSVQSKVILHVILIGSYTHPHASLVKRENAKFFANVARDTGGVFTEAKTVSDCFWLLSFGPGLGTNPRNGNVTLELAPGLNVPCTVWSLIKKQALPSLKKKRKVESMAGAKDGFSAGGDALGAGMEVDDHDIEISDIKRDTRLVHPSDPDLPLGVEDKVKGYRYGSQYVPVTTADESALRLQGPGGIFIIATVPASHVRRHHFMAPTLVLQGHDKHGEAQVMIIAFAAALRRAGSVCIARYVTKDNAEPFLVALIPPEEENGTLIVQRLPCREDTRVFSFASLPKPSADSPGMDAMSRFVDSMTVSSVPASVLSPVNPAYINMIADISRKMLGLGESEGRPRMSMIDHLPSAEIVPNPQTARQALLDLRAAFPLTRNENAGAASKKKVYFSDIMENFAAPAAAEAQSSTEPISHAPVLSLGSTSPADDFSMVLNHPQSTPDSRRAAIETMCDIVTRLIVDGGTASFYRKAVEGLVVLRGAVLKEDGQSVDLFNSFLSLTLQPLVHGREALHSLLTSAPPTHDPLAVASGLTVISSDDDPRSAYSPSDAASFWDSPIAQAQHTDAADTAPQVVSDSFFGDLM